MKSLNLVLLTVILVGCTVRGGFPRFLRKGEASDSAIAKDERQRAAARLALPLLLAERDTKIIDLAAIGKTMVNKYGAWNTEAALWELWGSLTHNASSEKIRDVIWLQDQGARVRDVAWMLYYTAEWKPVTAK